MPKGPGDLLPSCLVVHDDHWFLERVLASYAPAGPATVFVSRRAWNGSDGPWERVRDAAQAAGAEVVLGDWPDESLHRRVALEEMRNRGHQHVLIPDCDEVCSPGLLETLLRLAKADVAERVSVHMDTYWKSPRYLVRPRERLAPVLMLDAQACEHVHIREYRGGREIVLGPEHGVLHHLSYAGPDERILRKVSTWGHRDEVGRDWMRRSWRGWDRDHLLGRLHPTHPDAYGFAERIELPEVLRGCRDDQPVLGDPPPPARWPTVSVVVPLYGGEEDLRLCLESLRACGDLLHETIVVDDVSPDGAAGVAENFENVTLLRNERNLGFAGTCNRGYEASTGEVVLFLNSDTVVPRAGLVRLVESLLASGSVAAVGPYTNNAGYHQPIDPTYTSLETMPLFAQDFAHREAEDVEVDMLVGFCLAVRRSVLQEVGLFDEGFGRGLFEDNDLCYRIRRAGYRLRVAARAFVHHKGSQSLGRMEEPPNLLLERNMGVYHAKWREDVESGFASHLPGQRAEPIVFRPERSPEALRRQMAQTAKEADVSLCMIVRDEERVLGECLRSVQGVFSQVVVVDTGSKDRTKEIALEHGAELHEMVWPESFSEARNESLRHARGRWVFWMDADDTLPRASAEAILHAALTAPEEVAGFVVPVQFVEDGPGGGTRVDHVKLFRNLPGLRFEGRIHEQILPSLREGGGQIARLEAVVLHSGYDTSPEGQAKKRARDERLLRLDLEERPDHPFVLFNLGMTAHYTAAGDAAVHEEAVDWLRKSIAAAGPGESHVRKAYALLGVSLRELGRSEEALAAFEEGLRAVGEDPELRFQSALLLAQMGRLEEAREAYLLVAPEPTGGFASIDVAILTHKREHNLAGVCAALGRYREARDWWRAAIHREPPFVPSALDLFEHSLEQGDLATAREAVDAVRRAEGPSEAWATLFWRHREAMGEDPLPALHQAMREAPSAPGPRLVLARRLLERGEEAGAQPLLENLAREGVAEAAFLLGVCHTRRGDYQGALERMRQAQRLNPHHEPTNQQVEALQRALAAEV